MNKRPGFLAFFIFSEEKAGNFCHVPLKTVARYNNVMRIRGLLTFLCFLFSAQLQAFDESSLASRLGLSLISQGNPFNFLGVHSIYVNDSLHRQMMVVNNAPGEIKETQIIKTRGFIVVQIPTGPVTFTSIALVGISENEVRSEIKTTSLWKTLWRELNPLPKAYAETPCGAIVAAGTSSLAQLQEFFGSSVAKGAMNCMSSFLQGVWDSTGGMVQNAWEGLKNLVHDPGAWWDGKVKQLQNMKNFILNFDTKMKQMATTLVNLPDETKTMLICSFIGSLGTDVAIAMLTGGAGAANVMLKVESYLSKVMRLEKVFGVLNRIGKLKAMPPEFFKRLSSGKIPDDVVTNIGVFASHNLPEVAVGAMACAL